MVANTPTGYLETSRDPNVARRDPVIKRLKTLNTPFVYDQALYVGDGVPEIWETQAPFGYRTGIAMALHLPGGKHFLLGVDRPQALPKSDDVLTRLMADLQLLAVYAQETALRVLLNFKDDDAPVPRLTEREREVLQWTREGKSAWAVGQILSISEATVQTHLRNARQKLGASSKHVAILRAMEMGII
jgi:DNA-binding CsgD family transcriptional regulator